MSDMYEIGIAGRIGPLLRSCLPELTPTTEGESTVLTGTVHGPEELRHLLDLLDAHGLPPRDVRITYRNRSDDRDR
jgi:hypothetical protein